MRRGSVYFCQWVNFLFLLFPQCLRAQGSLKVAGTYSIEDGLIHNGVTSMVEDDKGYLWFGSFEGLCRYDGLNTEVYKNAIGSPLLKNNQIKSLAKDTKGNVWIGTEKGISCYNQKLDQFFDIDDYHSFKSPSIRKIKMGAEGARIIAWSAEEGAFLYNHEYELIDYFPHCQWNSFDQNVIDFLPISQDQYLVQTNRGLFSYDAAQGKYDLLFKIRPSIHGNVIRLNSEEFLCTSFDGIHYFKLESTQGQLRLLNRRVVRKGTAFTSVEQDSFGGFWLGSLISGIYKFNNLSDLLNLDIEPGRFQLPSVNLRISGSYVTSDQRIWVSSYNKGAFCFNGRPNPFHLYETDNTLSKGYINTMDDFDSCRAIVTVSYGSMHLFNTETNQLDPIDFLPESLRNAQCHWMFGDKVGDFWMNFGEDRGIMRYSKKKDKVEYLAEMEAIIPYRMRLRGQAEDDNLNLWLADKDHIFLVKMEEDRTILAVEDISQQSFFAEHQDLIFKFLYKDPGEPYIWIGSNSGSLIRLNPERKNSQGEFIVEEFPILGLQSEELTNSVISCMLRLPNGDFYVGTEFNGIYLFDFSQQEPSYTILSEKEGLSNNIVRNMLFDGEEGIWVSTDLGLNLIHTNTKEIRRFTLGDGLPFQDFWYSALRLKNNKMLMAGWSGLSFFDPKEVSVNEQFPTVSFGQLYIKNKQVNPLDTIQGRVILDKALESGDVLDLRYDENFFAVDFKAIQFGNMDNTMIRYQLLPGNESWIHLPAHQSRIVFNELQAGKYQLNIQASNALNKWTAPMTLNIHIAPPFWKTIYAYVVYTLVFILLFYLLMRVILNFNSLKYQVQIKELEKKQQKDLNDAKLSFFSNISHELKTPLTLITGLVEQLSLRLRGNEEIHQKLLTIGRQSRKMTELVHHVHEFHKSESVALSLEPEVFDFGLFMKNLLADFEYLAEDEGKSLTVALPEEQVIVKADQEKLEIIFNNLLSNAFKFTQEKDSISVSVRVKENEVMVWVKDSGMGIASEDLPHIFDRFFKGEHAQEHNPQGSGIGLSFSQKLAGLHYGVISVESVIQQGATFLVKLPIVSSEEINLDQSEDASADHVEVEESWDGAFESEYQNALIYVVEDNVDLGNYLKNTLSHNFQVMLFHTADACLKQLEFQWPDLIISDIYMPEMSGLELCEIIKSDLKTTHIPLMMLSASEKMGDQIKSAQVGADIHLQKPFKNEHLFAKIEGLLRSREQLQKRYQINYPLTQNKVNTVEEDFQFMEVLNQLIEENLDNPDLNIDYFHTKLHINRTHFFKKVKELTDMTPQELLRSRRMKKAATLLAENELSVNDVFMRSGFKSRAHFSKIFKETFGVAPSKYVAEHKHKID
ncbi:hybrid sensor histidine kinase/response regulator transcription factor [Persicobacter diffluens]|uniref:histidine kinase n=1 Tax=Persicobacter diffluens TaxID=981 RepID=A0AAN4W2R3_9BACT|nr:hybrid sensor histidine kinase/response regulator [Persicobacter diffluens]